MLESPKCYYLGAGKSSNDAAFSCHHCTERAYPVSETTEQAYLQIIKARLELENNAVCSINPVFHAILMYVPQIQYALAAIGINFEIIPLTAIDWLIVLGLGLAPIALLELTKITIVKREQAEMKPVSITNENLITLSK